MSQHDTLCFIQFALGLVRKELYSSDHDNNNSLIKHHYQNGTNG